MIEAKRVSQTEPAHSFLYNPGSLPPVDAVPDADVIFHTVTRSLKKPFNARQEAAFRRSFAERLLLLWGPPGTGKTTVLASIILGYLEHAQATGKPVVIGIGASNYNAIDNVLIEVIDLIERRLARVGNFTLPVIVARVRGDHSQA